MSDPEHQSVFDSLGAYALGALPESERAFVAAHIESCPICAEDSSSLQRAATRLIDVVPVLEPPPELRDRIMAVVEPEAALLRAASSPPEEVRVSTTRRPRASWLDALSLRWASAAAALLILGGAIGASVFDSSGTPDTRTLAADVGRGHAWVEMQDGKAHLVVNRLAPPGDGKVYELWVQRGTERPRPASADLAESVFVVRSGRVEIPARLEKGDRVLVTAEPSGGSRVPTAAPLVITNRV